MTEVTDTPAPYQVVYSGVVRAALREFAAAARAGGLIQEAAKATKELDRLLHLYPQFGEPLIDLTQQPGQIYLGAVPPLMVRYAVLEERRLVLVTFLRVLSK